MTASVGGLVILPRRAVLAVLMTPVACGASPRAHPERVTMPAGNLRALLLGRSRHALGDLCLDALAIFRRQALADAVESILDSLPKVDAAADGEVVPIGARDDRAFCDAGEKGDVALRRLAADPNAFDNDGLEPRVAGARA
jgi:hypothetical protein